MRCTVFGYDHFHSNEIISLPVYRSSGPLSILASGLDTTHTTIMGIIVHHVILAQYYFLHTKVRHLEKRRESANVLTWDPSKFFSLD